MAIPNDESLFQKYQDLTEKYEKLLLEHHAALKQIEALKAITGQNNHSQNIKIPEVRPANSEINFGSSNLNYICDEHFNKNNRAFLNSHPGYIELDILNYNEVTGHNVKPLFTNGKGKFMAINLPEIDSAKYFIFYSKAVNITSDNLIIQAIFDFDKKIEVNQIYSNWKVIKPAACIRNEDESWEFFEKGFISLENNTVGQELGPESPNQEVKEAETAKIELVEVTPDLNKTVAVQIPDEPVLTPLLKVAEAITQPEIIKTKNPVDSTTAKIFQPLENMVFVRGGTFKMGGADFEAIESEKPVHKMTLTYDFFIFKYPVTQKEWKALTGNNPSGFNGEDLPVEKVNWFDAIKYCNQLSVKNGLPAAYNELSGDLTDTKGEITRDISLVKGFRLPTEAEWEFAARGGNLSRGYKFSGSNIADEVAWFEGNSEVKSFGKNERQTHPVGSKNPNELGLYDMSGNVYEWCTDSFKSFSASDKSNHYVSIRDISKVRKGGSWRENQKLIRCSVRFSEPAEISRNNLGFRIVLSG